MYQTSELALLTPAYGAGVMLAEDPPAAGGVLLPVPTGAVLVCFTGVIFPLLIEAAEPVTTAVVVATATWFFSPVTCGVPFSPLPSTRALRYAQ